MAAVTVALAPEPRVDLPSVAGLAAGLWSASTVLATSAGSERRLDPARLGDHVDRLYRAAWAMCGSREDAEDLVQDTFARVLARPRILRREDDLGYLLRVLRNTFINQLRSKGRRPVSAPMPEDRELVASTPAFEPERALETSELFEAISALPDDFRDVLVAVDVAGLSYEETARTLRIKAASVPSRLSRARLRVADALAA
jgi:RNA polymerase sigma-70 factor (ECF subfamily)